MYNEWSILKVLIEVGLLIYCILGLRLAYFTLVIMLVLGFLIVAG